MKSFDERFLELEDQGRTVLLFILLLPQPVSLDVLTAITEYSPVTILQIFEKMVKFRVLVRDADHGAGYYLLSDRENIDKLRQNFLNQVVLAAAQRAITAIIESFPDNEVRWQYVAHIYHVSGLPITHYAELVRAAHCCVVTNRSADASIYYLMVLSGLEKADLLVNKDNYIDAAIGICTCRSNALPTNIQKEYLEKAVDLCVDDGVPERQIKLRILLARAFTKAGDYDGATSHLDKAWQFVPQNEISGDVRLLLALANSELLFWQGMIDQAIEKYEAAVENSEQLPNDLETLRIYVTQSWIYGIAGETARGLGLNEILSSKARDLNAIDLERYAILARVFILSDAGRIDEAETALAEIFQTEESQLDNFILWPGNGKRAYFSYCHGDFERAFFYQNQAYEHSLALEFPHHRGPDNLEYMLGLEQMGFVHARWNFQSEIDRLLSWPDIFMQGVALRYRALKIYKENGNIEKIEDDLKKSISLLSRSGARIELAHAWVLKARLRLRQRKIPAVGRLLKNAWEIFSKVNPNLLPKDLRPYLDPFTKHAVWLDSLLNVSNALGLFRPGEKLLNEIIRQSMRMSGAERGAIFIKNTKGIALIASRNLETEKVFTEIFASEMRIVDFVFESGTEFVQNAGPPKASIVANRARGWIGCWPIKPHGRVLGVLFMDCRLTGLELLDEEASLMRLVSNQASIALQNMEDFEEVVVLNNTLDAEAHLYRPTGGKSGMIGQAASFRKMIKLLDEVAKSDTTVMITGETGVGKELVAQAIHNNSDRYAGPFIAVNVVSLSPELISSELFGHEKGAFTGASQTRKGRFELASEGTLFLDDIDAFPLDLQARMLRILETKAFERVGGTKTLKTGFRLIAASNRRIDELVKQGLFRADFYFRLNVFPIEIPPLRERQEDIPALASHFMEMFSRKFGKQVLRISKNDLRRLVDYHWPGNVRELRHVIERAVLLSRNERLEIPTLNMVVDSVAGRDIGDNQILTLKELEARHIIMVLSTSRGKVSGPGGAAQLLGVKPTTLYSKMKRLGVKKTDYKNI